MAVRTIEAKTILNKSKRRDPWFLDDYTLNPFSGCSFNCQYCYIRGSKYGIHMEEKLAVKSNAVELLEKVLALRARKGQHGIIVLSSATDPYLPIEEKLQITRRLLEVILKYRFPVHVITKSDLVTRDFGLLSQIDSAAIVPPELSRRSVRGVTISFSFSTVDETVARIFEPGAPPPERRLKALRQAATMRFQAGASLMPLLPGISDTDEALERMFSKLSEAGAQHVFPASLTLFGNGPADSKTLTLEAVRKYDANLVQTYEKLFAEGYSVADQYRKDLERRTNELARRYKIRDSLAAG